MGIVLEADCVGKRFGGRTVLTSASLRVNSGQVLALLGRNGAGKSTLLKICAGLVTPDHGHIRFRSEQIQRPRFHQLARLGLAYLPSERNLFSSSFPLRAQFESVAGVRNSGGAVSEVVEALALGHCLDQAPLTLSWGEQRRASVALTWLLKPRCLLADEPLRGIDPRDQERIMLAYHAMAQAGCGIVVTGHQAECLLHAADAVVWVTAGTSHHLGEPQTARQHWQFCREFLGLRGNVA